MLLQCPRREVHDNKLLLLLLLLQAQCAVRAWQGHGLLTAPRLAGL